MARFDCAAWRPITVNTGGRLAPNLGLILHHQAGNGSLYGWFNNPSARVSAHFWVGKSGTLEQYVDSDTVAWHAMSLNARYVGVETEGCPAGRDEDLTGAQLDALGRLYAEGNRRHGWANAQISSDGQRGFGYHRMAVATACPCPRRLNMRGTILNRAFGTGNPPPPPPPAPQVPRLRVDYMSTGHNATVPDVRVYQQRMKDRGWTISVDQHFGPQTDQVTRAYQREKGLTADGKVGPVTWASAWTAAIT